MALNEIHAPLAINGPYFSSTTALPDSADQSETKIGMRVTNCVSLGSEFSFNPLLSKCVNDIRQLCLILQACDFVCQETSKNELSSGPGSSYATMYIRNSLSSCKGKKLINRIERIIFEWQTIP